MIWWFGLGVSGVYSCFGTFAGRLFVICLVIGLLDVWFVWFVCFICEVCWCGVGVALVVDLILGWFVEACVLWLLVCVCVLVWLLLGFILVGVRSLWGLGACCLFCVYDCFVNCLYCSFGYLYVLLFVILFCFGCLRLMGLDWLVRFCWLMCLVCCCVLSWFWVVCW